MLHELSVADTLLHQQIENGLLKVVYNLLLMIMALLKSGVLSSYTSKLLTYHHDHSRVGVVK